MNRFAQALSTIVALAVLAVPQHARAVTIEMVPVGNPGNAGDWQSYGAVGPAPYGAVSYSYRIGKYEVTNAQYVEFLNGVDPTGANTLALYDSSMTSYPIDIGGINFNSGAANGSKYSVKAGRDNNPVVFVSWYDSIRFANWLHNGQGSGDTENGAYTLGALGSGGVPINGNGIIRNPGAKWWLPSDDEWHKAAYHKNDGITGNYWEYPNSTDAVPYSDQPPGSDAPDQSNTANFRKDDHSANGYDDGYAVTGSSTLAISQNYLTDVGAYTLSTSPYGTFDQGGNVWEWIESLSGFGSGSDRALRGASWNGGSYPYQSASYQSTGYAGAENMDIGFRVATIPEPNTILLLAFGAIVALVMRHRFARTRQLVAAAFVASLAVQATIANAVTIQTVPIGNPGNPPDPRVFDELRPNGVGSVAYSFRMAATEVTNAQYVEFLNAVAATDSYRLYSEIWATETQAGIVRSGVDGNYTYAVKSPAIGQGPGGSDYTYANKPVVAVCWFDALRFANWMHNSQGSGDTESGAYTLLGPYNDLGVPSNWHTITRNPGARWWLPNDDEWYKAAYYDSVAGVYYEYPTGTDNVPNNNFPTNDTGNSANFLIGLEDGIHCTTENCEYPLTDAGAYTLSASPYGTFDQGGNVQEWNETSTSEGSRFQRGGSWNGVSGYLSYLERFQQYIADEYLDLGFRVATIPDLPGDFNHDGTVDASDYVVWRKNSGGSYTADDYNTWRAHFGQSFSFAAGSGANESAVPEPATFVLLMFAVAGWCLRRGRTA